MSDTAIVIEPHPFMFFGKRWTDMTVIGHDSAALFASYLVARGVEFHHDPAETEVHRFLVNAAPAEVEQCFDAAISPGREKRSPTAARPETSVST